MSESRRIRVRFPRFGRRRNHPPPDAGETPPAPEDAAAAPDPGGELDGFDPFPEEASPVPEPALTDAERLEAFEEARAGVPTPEAAAPSPGERRVENRFAAAAAAIRARADAALGRLDAERHRARARGIRLETGAERERERLASLSGALPACQRLEARYQEAQAAQKELAGFRRDHGLPDYRAPRQSGRGWAWLLVAVALAETTANGLLLHSASTEGVVASWTFAALITAMNVGLLGWLIGELIFRRMIVAGSLRRAVLALALVPCLGIAGLLHFGFAHYRDAVSALDGSRAALALDLDDIDAGADPAGEAPDPHPPARLRVEEAVVGELRAQFLWWTPGATFVDHPAGLPPADHSQDVRREVAAGGVGYRAEDGALTQVEDPRAGSFEGWRSVLLLAVGFIALALGVWKWFGGREPIPHFARLHRRREEAARALEEEYAQALDEANRDERDHRRRLGEAEADLIALGGRLAAVRALRGRVVAREAEFLARTVAAGVTAIEDYREANRQRRLSQDDAPAFWSEPWRPALPGPREDSGAAWDRDHELGLVEVMEAAERVRLANAAHAPRAAAAWEEVRERLAHAARLPGARRRPPAPRGGGPPPPGGGSEVRLVPRGSAAPGEPGASREPEAPRRLEAVS